VKETYALLNVAFSDEALSQSATCEWYLYLKVIEKCHGVTMAIWKGLMFNKINLVSLDFHSKNFLNRCFFYTYQQFLKHITTHCGT